MSENELTVEQKQALLNLARHVIARKLNKDYPAPAPESLSGLPEQCGAFVTLHKKGRLRGCIGRFTSSETMALTVEEMAEAAAFDDPRFPPLSPGELKDVDLEISVLTPLCKVDSPEEVEVGRHGIYIICGPNRGVLLPQVATEQGWDRQTFLEHTCFKAGLGPDEWRNPETEIYVFCAEVFGEKDFKP